MLIELHPDVRPEIAGEANPDTESSPTGRVEVGGSDVGGFGVPRLCGHLY